MEKRVTIPLIQAARGVAVMLVMLFHTAQMGEKYFQINFLGISDMGRSGGYAYFFVLTGFLMYTLYHNHFGNAKMWLPFMTKRLMRIYPLYWLVNAAVIPVYFLMPSFGLGFETKPAEIFRSLLLIPGDNPPILGVAWSLIYIVLFYAAFSLLFVMEQKAALAGFGLWMAIIGMNTAGWIHLKENPWVHLLFDPLNLEFVLGAGIAYGIGRGLIRQSGCWLIAGALMFPAIWLLRSAFPALPYVNTLYTIGSGLVLAGVGSMKIGMPRALKPLQFLGDASYSILLTSLACLSITLKLAKSAHLPAEIGAFGTTAICFALSLGLCCLIYLLVEKPLVRRMRSKLNRKPQTAAAS
ncbi:acyltransferase [Paenibacillus doosanensis]|uniref:acyltransferase family protein n=1 Tax=Paenibacillus doosanensis TaxID=1229154 RepID=UPI0021805D94|nr:acyltransferase [Paenibacillus doosanensis]MCS7464167.1 acyltransferase [Paenibacillus doosanensis]